MENRYRIRFATLRRALMLPLTAGIFVLLSFFTGKSEVKFVMQGADARQAEQTPALSKAMDSVKTVLKTPAATSVTNTTYVINKGPNMETRLSIDKSVPMNQKEIDKGLEMLSSAIKELDKLAAENNSAVREAGVKSVLSLFQINMNGADVGQTSFSDEFKSFLTPENLRKSSANFSGIKREIEKLNTEKSGQDKMNGVQALVMAIVQDELIKNALTEMMKTMMPQMDISKLINSTNFKNINAGLINANPQITSIVQRKSNENNLQQERDKKLLDEALRLKPGQISFCDIPFESETKLVSIEKGKKETKVTLAIPMHSDSGWFLFDKGFTIIDKKTKDRYFVRSLERNLPLDKIIVVEGSGGKMFEATLLFPPLRKSVEMVDIIENSSADAVLPSNHKSWSFRNIYIDDYATRKSKKSREYK